MGTIDKPLLAEPPAHARGPGAGPRAWVDLASFLPIKRRRLAVALSPVLLAITGYLDVATGPELSLSLFYLIPVFLATWFGGPVIGCVSAIVSAGVWLYAELMGAAAYTHLFNAYWNAVVRCIFFLIVSMLLSALRSLGSRLETLVEQRTAMLRRLGVQLAETEDAERRRLAQDMHDGLSQSLLLLKMNLDALRAAGTTTAAADPDQQLRLADSINLVDHVLQQTRTLMFDLHPAMLDDLGFVPTLSRFAEQFGRQAGVDVAISESGPCRPLARSLVHHLFRAVKELLSNAARHGKAKEVLVSVRWEPAMLRIVVDDDGCGFDVSDRLTSRSRPNLGLAGILERVVSLSGEFRVESVVGQGTRAVIEVPINVDESE
jgi:signal transduction histidine kinase